MLRRNAGNFLNLIGGYNMEVFLSKDCENSFKY